jgi:hypothetical protein
MTDTADRASGVSAAAAATIAAWEDPPRGARGDTAPVLAVEGFAGPLDWLLEMGGRKESIWRGCRSPR